MPTNLDGLDPRLPVLIGVGQHNQRVDRGEPSLEPTELMAVAARDAAEDAGASGGRAVLDAVDSVRVVAIFSWHYQDPGALLAGLLGIEDARTVHTTVGGNTPQMLVNRTAADIVAGRTEVALLAGAEAWRSRNAAKASGSTPDWTVQDPSVEPDETLGSDQKLFHPHEMARGVVMPVQIYPMFENAFRHHNGWSIDEHRARIGALWARFSEVASTNPHAWIQQSFTPEELVTPSADNRMIGFPYPKRCNSNNAVEQSAALIMTSVEKAADLGIPRDRWVFLHAGTEAHDAAYVSNRASLHGSPAIAAAGRAAFDLAGIGADDLAYVDLYSCFPSAVQVAATELGLGTDRDLTVTGGLSFAGGPWNNYVTHSIATMATRLREDPGAMGLCTANGGYLTKHAMGIYSTTPPENGFRFADAQAELRDVPDVALCEEPSGRATVEAYTVMHGREGDAELGLLAARLPDGSRAWGRTDEAAVLKAMELEEFVGRSVDLAPDGSARFS
jgi:acetyl-CoA C-acetyltransferase